MKKILKVAALVYIIASIGISVAYNSDFEKCAEIAERRNGLTIVSLYDENEIWVLNPLSNAFDAWLFGIKY